MVEATECGVLGIDPLGEIALDVTDSGVKVGQHDVLAVGFPCQPFSKFDA